jgi:hypothetical protein
MGTVVHVDFGQDRLLGKSELGKRLGRSVRGVEELTAQGMPSRIEGVRRVYKETACRNWLAAHGKTTKRRANG